MSHALPQSCERDRLASCFGQVRGQFVVGTGCLYHEEEGLEIVRGEAPTGTWTEHPRYRGDQQSRPGRET